MRTVYTMLNPCLTNEAQLLYAKTLHDLAAPLGALTLCLDDIKKALPESAEILETSIETLSQRIRYWRLMVTGSEQSPTYSEALEVMKAMAKIKTVEVRSINSSDYQGVYTRLLLVLVLVSLESLPRGGEITINADKGIVSAFGEKCYISQEFQEIFNCNVDSPSSRHALGLLTANLARCCGCSLKINHTPTELLLTLQKSED